MNELDVLRICIIGILILTVCGFVLPYLHVSETNSRLAKRIESIEKILDSHGIYL